MRIVQELANTVVRSQDHVVSKMSHLLRELRLENEAEGLKNSLQRRVVAIAHLRFQCSQTL